jgi:tetratricopeptide (TPR) repeat protein
MTTRICGHYAMLRLIVAIICLISRWTVSIGNDINPIVEKATQENDISSSDLTSLYRISQAWYKEESRRSEALQLYHHLADTHNHILSMSKLGHHYAQPQQGVIITQQERDKAVHYFSQAGEKGPHHASLFNAGGLLAEESDWVGALAYLRAASTLAESHPPQYVSEATTQSALEAYAIVSERVSREQEHLTLVQVADIFIFGSLQDVPDIEASHWKEAITSLIRFNQTLVESSGQSQDAESMKKVVQALRIIWESYGSLGKLSNLQAFLVLVYMNDMLSPLAALDDAYLPMAAGYSEALASLSLFCWDQYAEFEEDPSCFNEAVANAMAYYRRAGDADAAQRVIQIARGHPKAATHWKLFEQTPRVFHPPIVSQAWWSSHDVSAARALQDASTTSYKQIRNELQAVKHLPEGRFLRSSHAAQGIVELDGKGNIVPSTSSTNAEPMHGLQRIASSSVGVRTESAHTSGTGAGGYAEFGPLFDGISWNEANCNVVPTICKALQNDRSFCTTGQSLSVTSPSDVWKLCGANSVVTIRRLRPGTTILPQLRNHEFATCIATCLGGCQWRRGYSGWQSCGELWGRQWSFHCL